jgi:hypothetical protein
MLTKTQIRLLSSKIVLPVFDNCQICNYKDIGEGDNRIDTVYKDVSFDKIVKKFMKDKERPQKIDDKFIEEFKMYHNENAVLYGRCWYCDLGVWSDEEPI